MLTPATTLVSQISSAYAGPKNFNTYTQAQVGNNDRLANPVAHPYLQVTSMSVPVVSGQPLVPFRMRPAQTFAALPEAAARAFLDQVCQCRNELPPQPE
jgi:hypothetical protein